MKELFRPKLLFNYHNMVHQNGSFKHQLCFRDFLKPLVPVQSLEVLSFSEIMAFVYATHLTSDHKFSFLICFILKIFYFKLTFHYLNLSLLKIIQIWKKSTLSYVLIVSTALANYLALCRTLSFLMIEYNI